MIVKILNIIFCVIFINWALQFITLPKGPDGTNIIDIFFISGIFIFSLMLFYNEFIKKPTIEFIHWMYPDYNITDTNFIDKPDDIELKDKCKKEYENELSELKHFVSENSYTNELEEINNTNECIVDNNSNIDNNSNSNTNELNNNNDINEESNNSNE